MSFLESPRFPEGISRGATGGPTFQTTVTQTGGGQEYRNQGWSQPRRKYDVSHAARTFDLYKELLAFFLVANGRTNGFRFKDWADYIATAAQGRFVLLTSTTFQAYKRYTSGSSYVDRIIQKGVATWTVTGGTVASIDYTTGIVTMSSGTPTAWAGEYDVPARFDIDEMQATIIDGAKDNWIMGWEQIPILEIRV